MTFWQFVDKHFDAVARGMGMVGLLSFFVALIWGDQIIAALAGRIRGRR